MSDDAPAARPARRDAGRSPSPSVTLRLTIENPVPGVALALQLGRDVLLPPTRAGETAVIFEVALDVRTRPDGTPALAGAAVQGPPAARFLYVTVGVRAGQPDSPWERRAKVPLGTIPVSVLAAATQQPGMVLAARIAGRARDGGPACASVPLLGDGWQQVGGGDLA